MLELHKQAAGSEAARTRIEREINVTGEQIDALARVEAVGGIE